MTSNEEQAKSIIEMGYSREEVLKALESSGNNSELAIEILSNNDFIEERYKLVFLVRTDLGMGVGKIAAQVGHATLGAYKQSNALILSK